MFEEIYTAPWGDVLKIDEVRTYRKVSERPFYDEITEFPKIRFKDNTELFVGFKGKNNASSILVKSISENSYF